MNIEKPKPLEGQENDPEIAKEMALAEKPFRKKKLGMKPSEKRIKKGEEKAETIGNLLNEITNVERIIPDHSERKEKSFELSFDAGGHKIKVELPSDVSEYDTQSHTKEWISGQTTEYWDRNISIDGILLNESSGEGSAQMRKFLDKFLPLLNHELTTMIEAQKSTKMSVGSRLKRAKEDIIGSKKIREQKAKKWEEIQAREDEEKKQVDSALDDIIK